MKLKIALLSIGLFFGVLANGYAQVDPQIENRAKELEKLIIAPCCWTNPISEHHSEISYELRKRIRVWLQAGTSEEQIKNLLVAEYGERIMAKPRARGFNTLVWVIPPVVFLLVLVFGLRYLKGNLRGNERRSQRAAESKSVPKSGEPTSEQMNQARKSVEEALKNVQSIG